MRPHSFGHGKCHVLNSDPLVRNPMTYSFSVIFGVNLPRWQNNKNIRDNMKSICITIFGFNRVYNFYGENIIHESLIPSKCIWNWNDFHHGNQWLKCWISSCEIKLIHINNKKCTNIIKTSYFHTLLPLIIIGNKNFYLSHTTSPWKMKIQFQYCVLVIGHYFR